MFLAKVYASWSKDPSSQVGAVVARGKYTISSGYNGFPPGVDDSEERLNNRDLKYPIIRHAEENCILNAAKEGIRLAGSTIYSYPFPPCADRCAGMIISVGIKRVVYEIGGDPERADEWRRRAKLSFDQFKEVGIEVIELQPYNDMEIPSWENSLTIKACMKLLLVLLYVKTTMNLSAIMRRLRIS